jgi:hypothetical protein
MRNHAQALPDDFIVFVVEQEEQHICVAPAWLHSCSTSYTEHMTAVQ